MDNLEVEDPLDDFFRQMTASSGTPDQLSQIQFAPNDDQKTRITELQEQLAQAHMKIHEQRRKIQKIEQSKGALKEYIDREAKVQNDLTEKQNMSDKRLEIIQEQTATLRCTLKSLRESRDEFKEMHNNVILKQDVKIQNLKQQRNNHVSNDEKELKVQLSLQDEQYLHLRMKLQQFGYQNTHITQVIHKLDCRREKLEKWIYENRQKCDEEIKNKLDTLKDIEAKLKLEQDKESKLLAARTDCSTKYEELMTSYQSLQATASENEKHLESMKSNIQQLKDKQGNCQDEIDGIKSATLAVLSARDLETAENRQQIQDLSSKITETANKLTEINAKNEESKNNITKSLQHIEELKKAILNKDDEMKKLSEELNKATNENEELSVQSQSLNEQLISRKKVLLQAKSDYENCNTEDTENCKKESELRTKLTGVKEKLKNKKDELARLRKDIGNEKCKSSENMIKYKAENEEKDKQITELKKMRDNLNKESECLNSEYSKKLEPITNSIMECQSAGHEERIKDQYMKINIIRQNISAEKLKHKQEGIKRNDADRKEKEKREANLKEMKSNVEKTKEVLSASVKQLEDLKKTLKSVQIHNANKSPRVPESSKSSKLLGVIYGKHETMRASSTPQHSPQLECQAASIQFDFDSSDVSSINGSDIFEAAERQYAAFLKNNKTDNAKLNHPNEDKSTP